MGKMHRKVSESAPIRFSDAPRYIQALPTDKRGFPVPYFTPIIDGVPDFTTADSRLIRRAHTWGLCWICGQRRGRMAAFVIGPMCSVNRISIEPPSHPECAEWASRRCPFLARPLAKRAEQHGFTAPPPGIMLEHNPGVTLIWWTLRYRMQPLDNGVMFDIGKPERVMFRREGRDATRAEALDALNLGLPKLRALAEEEGAEAVADMNARLAEAMKFFPAA